MILRGLIFICYTFLCNICFAQPKFFEVPNGILVDSAYLKSNFSNKNLNLEEKELIIFCFLDKTKPEFSDAGAELDSLSDVFGFMEFIIFAYDGNAPYTERVKFYDEEYRILGPQFYVQSPMCALAENSDILFLLDYKKLPKNIKRIDTRKCQNDRSMSVLINSVLRPEIDKMNAFYKQNKLLIEQTARAQNLEIRMNLLSRENKKSTEELAIANNEIKVLKMEMAEIRKTLNATRNNSFPKLTLGFKTFLSNGATFSQLPICFSGMYKFERRDLFLTGSYKMGVLKWESEKFFDHYELTSTRPEFEILNIDAKAISEDYTFKFSLLDFGVGVDFLEKLLAVNRKFKCFNTIKIGYAFKNTIQYENTGGQIDYYGRSSGILEDIRNVQDLDLQNDVSYVGTKGKSELNRRLSLNLGLDCFYPLAKNLFISSFMEYFLITPYSRNNDNIPNAISSKIGNYNSLLTERNSKFTVPGRLSFGLGVQFILK